MYSNRNNEILNSRVSYSTNNTRGFKFLNEFNIYFSRQAKKNFHLKMKYKLIYIYVKYFKMVIVISIWMFSHWLEYFKSIVTFKCV